MSGERYWLHTPTGRQPLPGSLRPSTLSPMAVTPRLERARGYRQVFDLSDGLPDPVPVTLTGEVECSTEAELSAYLTELHGQLRVATAFDRDERRVLPLLSASLIAVPVNEDSNRAALTVTLLLAEVPDPNSDDPYW